MEFGHALTAWTIRLALLAYVVSIALGFPVRGVAAEARPRWQISRFFWTAGSLCLLAHLAAAFQFYHGWSHRRAFEDTAKQTQELLGWAFGGGIFFSYLFALVWLGDALWWRLAPVRFARRPRPLHFAIHAYLAFIAFQGAIVFETGVTRWIGLAVVPVLVLITCRRYRGAIVTPVQ